MGILALSGPAPSAIVLLSGGLDSATCLALARRDGYRCQALTFGYGQRHTVELDAARRVARALGVEQHLELALDLGRIGGSALTTDQPVPRDRPLDQPGIPSTYVPARNTIFLSYALAWAEVLRCTEIFIGVNALDYSGYPDCRPRFVEAFEELAAVATRLGTEEGRRVKIRAPLLRLTKAEIVQLGLELGLDHGLTHSCYDPLPDGRACGRCDACRLRLKGFDEAGLSDPLPYADP